ncbi:HSP20-like chaperone [Absidia repens]|uniref:HSP20-like chaperone n=1 Tax=Absidia repens TaxID=90262 RepID=A0A1X2I6U8_9FUNG|nr:HSP20-like chaperone [Absidia repens]
MGKCTHQGCGKDFDEEININNACQFHSGAPVFHEGLKGWSYCKKRMDDFDEFLQIPAVKETLKPSAPATSASSVKNGVETYGQQQQTSSAAPPTVEFTKEAPPTVVGTTCRRRGCGSMCHYHPGAPVFHEGSKGWSCCPRKVLEFDEFLKIKGCTVRQGHSFVGNGNKKDGEQQEELVDCRLDWYQTQTNVIISIFAKNKNDTQAKFISRAVDIDIKMKDNKRYKKRLPLFHLIDCEGSKFTALTTKVEINLKKMNGMSWAALEPTADVKTWTTFGVTGTGGTVGSKEMHYSGDSPLHM